MKYTNLKRVGDYFSVNNKQELARADIELCDKCGFLATCKIRKRVKKIKGVSLPIKMCKEFTPYITFSILDGVREDSFNTMRLGKAWASRLKVDDFVFLYDTKREETISMRKVSAIVCDSKDIMLKEHAKYNHTVIGRTDVDPVAYVERVLINTIGKNFYNAQTHVTAIYFKG